MIVLVPFPKKSAGGVKGIYGRLLDVGDGGSGGRVGVGRGGVLFPATSQGDRQDQHAYEETERFDVGSHSHRTSSLGNLGNFLVGAYYSVLWVWGKDESDIFCRGCGGERQLRIADSRRWAGRDCPFTVGREMPIILWSGAMAGGDAVYEAAFQRAAGGRHVAQALGIIDP